MSSIDLEGLIEMPPVSKVTPLPTSATVCSPEPHSRRTSRGGFAEPEPTASTAFIPRLSSSAGPSTSTARPCSPASSPARSASQAGLASLGGVLPRSRALAVAVAIVRAIPAA